MIRFLSLLGCLCAAVISRAAPDQTELNASIRKDFPPVPEANGIRLEVNADLSHSYGSDGSGMAWHSGYLTVEVALHNVSSEPITVPTTAYEARPYILKDRGMERIVLRVEPSRFQGKPTAFVSAHFTPVTLQPGEYVLLLKHRDTIMDRDRADAIAEASFIFDVSKELNGPKEWWEGRLVAYAPIRRTEDPEEYIKLSNASFKKYAVQKEAEKDPNYGVANAARIAALIAEADQVVIRGEGNDQTGAIVVRDLDWIRSVSGSIAAVPLPRTVSCLCTGYRTAYFQKGDAVLVRIAAIHGNQLRIYWSEGGGDYEVSEADWKAVKQILAYPDVPKPTSEPASGVTR